MRIRHKKSLHICIIFRERKNGEKSAIGKEKEKEHQYLYYRKKLQHEQSENDGHFIISEK